MPESSSGLHPIPYFIRSPLSDLFRYHRLATFFTDFMILYGILHSFSPRIQRIKSIYSIPISGFFTYLNCVSGSFTTNWNFAMLHCTVTIKSAYKAGKCIINYLNNGSLESPISVSFQGSIRTAGGEPSSGRP
ncbi:hypothetical protein AA313_de0206988 [Arthrobotrys entomopaga]|nr:hypothetical protein AA313_de0206988 [Arthrobotrys entomopaga]